MVKISKTISFSNAMIDKETMSIIVEDVTSDTGHKQYFLNKLLDDISGINGVNITIQYDDVLTNK